MRICKLQILSALLLPLKSRPLRSCRCKQLVDHGTGNGIKKLATEMRRNTNSIQYTWIWRSRLGGRIITDLALFTASCSHSKNSRTQKRQLFKQSSLGSNGVLCPQVAMPSPTRKLRHTRTWTPGPS